MSKAAKMMEVALDRIVSLSQDECKIIARFAKEQEKNQNLTELLEEYKKDLELTQKRLGDSLQERLLLCETVDSRNAELQKIKANELQLDQNNDKLCQQLEEQKNNYELLDAARQDQISDLLKQREEKNTALRQIRELVDRTYGEHYGPTLKQINQILIAAGLDRQPKKPSHTSLEGGLSG